MAPTDPVVLLGTVEYPACPAPRDHTALKGSRELKERWETWASQARRVPVGPPACKGLPDHSERGAREARRVPQASRELLAWVVVLETRVPRGLQA